MDRFLTTDEVVARTHFSRKHLAELEARGDFPRRRRLGARRVAWLESEITEWMQSRPFADEVRPDAGGDLPARGFGNV